MAFFKERYVKLTQESLRFRENEVPVCKGNQILNIYERSLAFLKIFQTKQYCDMKGLKSIPDICLF